MRIMRHCFVLYFQWWYNYKFSHLISKKSLLLLKASVRQKSQIFVALCLEFNTLSTTLIVCERKHFFGWLLIMFMGKWAFYCILLLTLLIGLFPLFGWVNKVLSPICGRLNKSLLFSSTLAFSDIMMSGSHFVTFFYKLCTYAECYK